MKSKRVFLMINHSITGTEVVSALIQAFPPQRTFSPTGTLLPTTRTHHGHRVTCHPHSSEEPGETGSESPSPLPRGPRRTRQGSLFPGQVRAGPAVSQLPFLIVHPSSPESHQPPAPCWVLPPTLDPNPARPSPIAARAVEQLPHWRSAPRTAPQKPLYKTRTLSLSLSLSVTFNPSPRTSLPANWQTWGVASIVGAGALGNDSPTR